METEHNWFIRGCLWFRDHSGALVATFGMIVVLYAIGGLLAYAFFQLDYYFSRPLAGDVIPPEVTQMVAWGIRAITLIAGMAAIYFHTNDMPSWRKATVILGAAGAVLLLSHAYGVAAKIMDGQYAAVSSVEQVEQIDVSAISNQIDTLRAQKAEIRADRDVAIQTAQQGIDSVKDQVPGLSTDDNITIRGFQADKERAQQDASAAIAGIDTRILELQDESRATSTTATKSTAQMNDFNPLFGVMARLVGFKFDPAESPSDGRQYVSGLIFFTFFFGFGEIALIFCLTAPYAALQVVSMRKRDAKDPARVEAGKKAAQTRSRRNRQSEKIEHQASSYFPQYRKAMGYAKNTTYTAKGIAKNAFDTVPGDMESKLSLMVRAKLISQDDVEIIMRRANPPERDENRVDVVKPETLPAVTDETTEEDIDDDSRRSAS